MANQASIPTGISLLLVGIAILVCSLWLYQRMALAEAQGLHFRIHWFFYAIYKFAGKGVVCILIGIIGLAVAGLGVRKFFIK